MKRICLKVFVAEDTHFMRERIINSFSGIEGIELAGEAWDVPTAISGILSGKPDVVILDIRIPGGNGFDVLRRIKVEPDAPKVIVLTNYPWAEYREEAIKLGAVFFFDKSMEFEKALAVLQKMRREISGIADE